MNNRNIHFKSWKATVTSGIQISQARGKVRELARSSSFSHTEQVLISSTVSECCRILLDHFSAFKIYIENKYGLYVKIYMLKENIKRTKPLLHAYPIDILSILNLELLNSQHFFDEVLSVRENGCGPHLVLKKWKRDSPMETGIGV